MYERWKVKIPVAVTIGSQVTVQYNSSLCVTKPAILQPLSVSSCGWQFQPALLSGLPVVVNVITLDWFIVMKSWPFCR